MTKHEIYMQRALELARRGEFRVFPNPMVGSVIVKENQIISEAWHEAYGYDHAEIAALKKLKGSEAKGASMYINLEPCCHYGLTPPCVDKIIESQISEIYIAMLDPNPKVCGKSISKLKDAGIRVELGLLELEAKALNKAFCDYITQKKPYVIAKWAMSLDGKIASAYGESRWISSYSSRQDAHILRSKVDAIIIGSRTLILDDPELNVRLEGHTSASPFKVVILGRNLPDFTQKLFKNKDSKTIIFYNQDTPDFHIESESCRKILVPMDNNGSTNLKYVLKELYKLGALKILVEGGGKILASFFEADLVDEIVTYIAPKIIGGQKASTPVSGNGFFLNQIDSFKIESHEQIDDDIKVNLVKQH